MKRLLLFAVCAASALFSFSQKIKGKVVDASTNIPLSGASVTYAGKVGGTFTDKDGLFSIDCNKSLEIIISFVGYEIYKQKIKNCDDELKNHPLWREMSDMVDKLSTGKEFSKTDLETTIK